MDTWDRTREVVEATWSKLPDPLPGFDTEASVSQLLAWATNLAASPRVDDADAGDKLTNHD